MAHAFRPYDLEQLQLLPQRLRDWLPEGHLAEVLYDVVSLLDLSPILRSYGQGRGPRGYHPQMLLTVLLYGYATGVYSSRKIAARCEDTVAFRVLSAEQFPDFRTIADFRKRHLAAFPALFDQVVAVARETGLLTLGHLSLDGSKYRANASKHKARSYGRIDAVEPGLRQEIRRLLAESERQDAAEDEEYGVTQRGDDVPTELRRRETRLEKMVAAKQRLEERARQREAAALEKRATPQDPAARAAQIATATPKPKEQSNFTDPDSRIMKTKDGWIQGYNAQVLVDADSGIIVAQAVSAQAADSPHLVPLLDQMAVTLAAGGLPPWQARPGVFTADAGYCSEANLAALDARQVESYVATGRERHHRQGMTGGWSRSPLRNRMRQKLQTAEGRAIYARRKCITEPVHGQIKQARGFRQFLLRGLPQVQGEFTVVALAHNLLKLWRATLVPA